MIKGERKYNKVEWSAVGEFSATSRKRDRERETEKDKERELEKDISK